LLGTSTSGNFGGDIDRKLNF